MGNPKAMLNFMPQDRDADSAADDDAQDFTSLIGEWLQFYGPTTSEHIGETLGIGRDELSLALDDLVDSQKIIVGQLVEDVAAEALCDSENFEILLRLTRRDAVPSFEPLEFEWLTVFLANFQKLTTPADDVDGLLGSN